MGDMLRRAGVIRRAAGPFAQLQAGNDAFFLNGNSRSMMRTLKADFVDFSWVPEWGRPWGLEFPRSWGRPFCCFEGIQLPHRFTQGKPESAIRPAGAEESPGTGTIHLAFEEPGTGPCAEVQSASRHRTQAAGTPRKGLCPIGKPADQCMIQRQHEGGPH